MGIVLGMRYRDTLSGPLPDTEEWGGRGALVSPGQADCPALGLQAVCCLRPMPVCLRALSKGDASLDRALFCSADTKP